MWQRILSAGASLSALIIGLSAVLVSYDVIARNINLPSFNWIVDMTEYALPLATLLVAPWLAQQGGHIKIDLVALILPKRILRKLDFITNIICIVVCAILAWFSIGVILESYDTGAVVIKNIVFKEWWVFVPLPPCFALLAIEFLRLTFSGNKPDADAPQE